jgi:pimeloyl-ACP methyl ester carboxylesterase
MARRAIVLLPGLICDRSVWAPQAAALAPDCDVLAFADFYGHRSLETMADAVLEAAPERFALAGHSMGARVALTIMNRAPERVERLALLDLGVTPPGPEELAHRQALLDIVAAEGIEGLVRAWLPDLVHASRHSDSLLMDSLGAMIRHATPEIYAGQIVALLARPDFRPLLAKITCPTLVLSGDDDKLSSAHAHRAIAAAIAGARLAVISVCGHMATVERPEQVNTAFAQWLA